MSEISSGSGGAAGTSSGGGSIGSAGAANTGESGGGGRNSNGVLGNQRTVNPNQYPKPGNRKPLPPALPRTTKVRPGYQDTPPTTRDVPLQRTAVRSQNVSFIANGSIDPANIKTILASGMAVMFTDLSTPSGGNQFATGYRYWFSFDDSNEWQPFDAQMTGSHTVDAVVYSAQPSGSRSMVVSGIAFNSIRVYAQQPLNPAASNPLLNVTTYENPVNIGIFGE